MVHLLCRAYGLTPMQVLEMGIEEFAITLACFRAGENRVAKISGSGIVFPAVIIN